MYVCIRTYAHKCVHVCVCVCACVGVHVHVCVCTYMTTAVSKIIVHDYVCIVNGFIIEAILWIRCHNYNWVMIINTETLWNINIINHYIRKVQSNYYKWRHDIKRRAIVYEWHDSVHQLQCRIAICSDWHNHLTGYCDN